MDFILIFIIAVIYAFFRINNNRETKLYRFILICYAVIYFMSSLNLYGLYDVSDYAVLLLLISIIMISIGFSPRYLVRVTELNDTDNGSVYESRGFLFISFALMFILAIYVQRFLSIPAYDYYAIRMSRFETGIVFRSLLEITLYNYLVAPFIFIQMCVLIYGLVEKKIRFPLAVCCLIDIVCYLVIGYGRLSFLQIFFIFIVVIICENKKINIKQMRNKLQGGKTVLLILSGCATFALILFFTAKRLGYAHVTFSIIAETVETTVNQFYTYACGSQRALDYALKNYNLILGRHAFRMTFSGIDEIISNALLFIGFSMPSMNSIYGQITQQSVPIGNNQAINALFTGVFNFYFDAGIIGVIIYSLLLGVVFKYFINRYYKRRSLPNLVILCDVAFCVFAMPIRWMFSSSDMILIIIFCLIWDRRLMRRGN